MHIDDLSALLKRYHEGKCTPGERQIIEEWYDGLSTSESSPGDAEISASLDKVFDRLQLSADLSVRKANAGLDERAAGPDRPGQPARTHRLRRPWMAAAAAVLLLAGAYALTRLERKAHPSGVAGADSVLVATHAGEVHQVSLPDGSTITLNANSRLAYPRVFGSKTREVRLLTGEAFFQVAPDPARPFIAEVGGMKTTVLGTSFNIRSYDRDTATVIALLTGKVTVGDTKAPPVTMTPGDVLSVGKSGPSLGHFDRADDVIAWEQKAMIFRDASFEDIAFEVENTYNVRLINISTKKHWSYTGYFEHESVWEIIRTICITEHLDYRSDHDQVIFINKN